MARDSQPSVPAWWVTTILAVLQHAAIRAALAEVVVEALPQQTERAGLLTSDELCEALKISRSKLDGLVADGMPHVMCGSARRFQLNEVVEHLRSRDERKVA